MARTITPATIQARPAFFFGLNLRFGSAAAVATTPDVGKRDLHLGQVTMPSSSSGDGAAEMRAPQPGQKTFIGRPQLSTCTPFQKATWPATFFAASFGPG